MNLFNKERYDRILRNREIHEIRLSTAKSNPDFRIDSEFFRDMPNETSRFTWTEIGACLIKTQYGLSVSMNETGDGFPIYRMNEIDDMLCVDQVDKYADVSSNEAEEVLLEPRDVLFNRTNSQKWVGRTGLFLPYEKGPRLFASYLVRLLPNRSLLLPEFLVAFLNSSRAVIDIKRRARISINQSNVNPEELKAMRIPLVDMAIQERIADVFSKAHALLVQARSALREAEAVLLEELDLNRGNLVNDQLSYIKNSRDVFRSGRLDSQHFNPQCEALERHILSTHQYAALGDLLSVNKRGIQPDYADEGIRVVNSKDVWRGGGPLCKRRPEGNRE